MTGDQRRPAAPGAQEPPGADVRALQVELRAAREELAQRDESLGRLVALLRQCERLAVAQAAAARHRVDGLAAQVAALQASRVLRWSAPVRRTARAAVLWWRRR